MYVSLRPFLLVICIAAISSTYGFNRCDSSKSLNLSRWAFDVLNIPVLDKSVKGEIIVAVVDDGFSFSHNSLQGFIFTNNGEIPRNMVDDDHNGFIDDYQGWDVSDHDGNVQITKSNAQDFYHGTFVSSLITQIVSKSFGDNANQKVKILPIKVLSDHAEITAIRDGYKGIEYATKMGADIICCAWSGGNPTMEEMNIISMALQKNILIIGSAGNSNQENVDFPASINGIMAIAAIDTLLKKSYDSNFGMRIDMAFPGENVKAAYPVANNAWFYGRGTSASAGLAAGCATVLQGMMPEALPHEVIEALKNSTQPIDSINNSYCGKLGSGLPDLSKAVDYLLNPNQRHAFFNPERPEGTLYISNSVNQKDWEIKPWGAYKSVTIIPEQIRKKDLQKQVHLFDSDSLFFKGPLETLQGGITMPGGVANVTFITGDKKRMPTSLKLNYFVQTIDSANLYCGGIIQVEADEGFISDNSGEANYANNCACTWHIFAPGSDQIHISFADFNTEAKVDYVWLFDGFEAHPDNIIAKFSGSNIPPAITSRTNRVKVWFVTDNKRNGEGWHLHFKGQNDK